MLSLVLNAGRKVTRIAKNIVACVSNLLCVYTYFPTSINHLSITSDIRGHWATSLALGTIGMI